MWVHKIFSKLVVVTQLQLKPVTKVTFIKLIILRYLILLGAATPIAITKFSLCLSFSLV